MRSRSRRGMPMPRSRTTMSTQAPSVRASTVTVLPDSLYFTALSIRLATADTSWRRSPRTVSPAGTSPSSMAMPCCSAAVRVLGRHRPDGQDPPGRAEQLQLAGGDAPPEGVAGERGDGFLHQGVAVAGGEERGGRGA